MRAARRAETDSSKSSNESEEERPPQHGGRGGSARKGRTERRKGQRKPRREEIMNHQSSEMHTAENMEYMEEGPSARREPNSGGQQEENDGNDATRQTAGGCPWIFNILALDGTTDVGQEMMRRVEGCSWKLRDGIAEWPTLMDMQDWTTEQGHPSFEQWTSNNRRTWNRLDDWMKLWDDTVSSALCQKCWSQRSDSSQTSAWEEQVQYWSLAHVHRSSGCEHHTDLDWLWRTRPPNSCCALHKIRQMVEESSPARAEGHRVFCTMLWMIMLERGLEKPTEGGD